MLKANIVIISIIFVSIFIIIFSFIVKSSPKDNLCLSKSYELYKKDFMSKEGRIIDYNRDNVTTSEGQSYILLRSLLMNDKETFNLVYKWTKNNLQRKDKLFAWLWGKNQKGEYKILDYNSASDADIDIAFSLLLAHEKWRKYKYLEEAKFIINSIWNNETRRVGNYLILTPGADQNKESEIEVNPSYFSPYAFRLFQKYDEIHDWNLLIDSSYYYLKHVMNKTDTNLPPNWFLIQNGQIVLENSERSDFSYDAVRVFARIYLDFIQTGEKRAQPILEKSKFFVEKWETDKHFYTNYQKNGKLRNKIEFSGAMALLIPAISTYDKKTAYEMYKKKISPYVKNKNYWIGKNNYYEKNLIWFGLYLYEKKLKKCDIKSER